ncbi:uncharacterized protein K452DRAFT_225808 [Aplosporella prunicola CBS 121167]|uniref:Uncharacterized protein n=1 Tax=Aplosporella prunicola CBS 121167 TaxID=1176127 RepID=A0A6A6BHK9_9PEZI|nr:uncharacterized protein K452DRAFT_225808 [Aplosporella prunicola CBS 121167]KAF2142734.1 hypothetical protein K452DRAFT_225808 [Aplosporella prunicola CBS 121167]
MCIRLVEKYAVCGCTYHVHSIDPCASYGHHAVVDRVVSVGYCCTSHAKTTAVHA